MSQPEENEIDQKFFESLELIDIVPKEIHGSIDHDKFKKFKTDENNEIDYDYDISEHISFREAEELFEVKIAYIVVPELEDSDEDPPFRLELSFIGRYKADVELNDDILEKFLPNFRFHIYPFFREQALELARKMKIDNFHIPLLKLN